MVYEKKEPVEDTESDEIILGRSSWHDGADLSLKYAWLDSKNRRARGGELPIYALRQAVRFAAQEDYLDRTDTVRLIQDLAGTLISRAEGPGSV